MMRWHWLDCLLYLLLLGLLCFPAGRILALIPFDPESYPFRSLPFERNGKIYDAIHIRSWQKLAPDVSKLVPGIVPKKAVEGKPDAGTMDRMLRETCVAELTHWLLCVAGIALFWLWPGMGGVVVYILYVILGNLPFILIQRYHRPRLLRTRAILEKRERRMVHAGIDPEF